MKRILVTGSVGQIGSELTLALRQRFGAENVVATGRKTPPSDALKNSGPFYFIDVANRDTLEEVVRKHSIDTIVHMAAILSAVGEQNPMRCWDVNINGTLAVLECAREHEMARVIIPSSIAAFGPETPRDRTPNDTILKPRTMYGVTKVAGELLADYYFRKYGLDVRGLRYPGIISHETLPGGGTTDFAVAIYFEAVKNKRYTCFVREDTRLPMMYMPDCIKATIDLAEADVAKLKHHSDFNVGAMSFSAGELAASIRKHIPDFVCTYEPDFRQAIADSWPMSLDDSAAREEWGWKPAYDLEAMTKDMLEVLGRRHSEGKL
ncbi:L-threonine 3-dehydrogenase [candidate division WOR-3 bacterium]|uniref:L-threonine 3-dehydrogenase n=1 Tax=candidate division WOR-3 bacterium TaxID=2052148 RepID=A0A938BPX9_UNCW3|nr:L-threonine 3-dehydrogenase [candidate division WOR-3 bacterium]